jgi:PAS domain S-box-containing protein
VTDERLSCTLTCRLFLYRQGSLILPMFDPRQNESSQWMFGRVITLAAPIRYGVAIAAAVAAIFFRLALDPLWGSRLPFITLFPAVIFSGWVGGFWPGIVTTVLCMLAAQYFWLEPARSFAVADKTQLIGLFTFAAVGGMSSALNEAWRRATLAAVESARRLRIARGDAERSAERLRVALEAGRMGAWEYEIATGAVKWSTGLETIHGVSPRTLPRTLQAFRDQIHSADRDRVLDVISESIRQRLDHHIEYRIVRPDGSIRWIEGHGQIFTDGNEQPERVVGLSIDITERKRLDEGRADLLVRERAARADVERASRLKDEFLAALSHELRTPLNAVLGYAHLLNSGGLASARATHAIQAIQRNAQAQARLVESLLDLSRVMAGKLELNLEELDLSRVIDTAIDVVRPDADAKAIRIDVEYPSSGLRLVGDAVRLQQVLWNLLSNAVKFTQQRGRVRVRVTQSDSQAQIEVSDNGHGISASFLPQVFDRLKQAHIENGRMPSGLGLGLALVREMVQAHGGTVAAESRGEGRGSTFTVTLPRSVDTTGRPTVTRDRDDDAIASLRDIEILVVDDDRDARDLLTFVLESRGAIVRAVSSAAEALEAAAQQRPDVLLADLRMPGQDGYALIRNLRTREHEQQDLRLAAIAVTAYASSKDRDEAIAAGYDAHVAKPVDLVALAHAIATLASGKGTTTQHA